MRAAIVLSKKTPKDPNILGILERAWFGRLRTGAKLDQEAGDALEAARISDPRLILEVLKDIEKINNKPRSDIRRRLSLRILAHARIPTALKKSVVRRIKRLQQKGPVIDFDVQTTLEWLGVKVIFTHVD